MIEYVYPEGTACEVTHPPIRVSISMPKSYKNNLPELYKALLEAKTKAEAGAAMRKFIVWNDVPDEVWEKMESWFPIKK